MEFEDNIELLEKEKNPNFLVSFANNKLKKRQNAVYKTKPVFSEWAVIVTSVWSCFCVTWAPLLLPFI